MTIVRLRLLGLLLLAAVAQSAAAKVLTGTHFVNYGDFHTLRLLGYDFAVIILNPDDSSGWKPALDAAQAAGIQLIVGAYPPPYQLNGGSWTITGSGTALLNYLRSRSDLVLALYGFNEPYSTNPYNSTVTPCGYFSAGDLRGLRTTIQSLWPGVKIYHDLGDPEDWSPGSSYAASHPCVGNKYADQTGVADYVGVWHYPFTAQGYDRAGALAILNQEINYVLNSMQPAQPISLNQTYACGNCEPGLVFPTPAQMLDWNCATRSLPLAGVDWYPWQKFSSYTRALGDDPSYWPLSTADACDTGMGAAIVGVSAAMRLPFVAAGSLVSIYGTNLAGGTQPASSQPLPASLAGASLQVRDAAGTTRTAALDLVSPGQINFVMPDGTSAGQAALSLSNGIGPPLLGTVLVRPVAPALFSADGSGTGAAAATAMRVGSDSQVSAVPVYQCGATACTTVPIDLSANGPVYLTLYGTGIRNFTDSAGLYINGTAVPVLYAGPQGQYEGLDQVNAGPLAGLSGSGEVSLVLLVDGQASNAVRVNFH